MVKPEYVHLHTHSHYSMLDGFPTIEEYVEKAVELVQPGIGITDHGNTYGINKLLQATRSAGIAGVPGCEFYLAPINPEGARVQKPVFYGAGGKKDGRNDVSRNGSYLHLTVWAYNNVGLQNLFKLSSISYKQEHFRTQPRIDFNHLADHAEGLIVSTGCPSSEISTRFLLGQDKEAYEYARRLKEVFGDRLFVEIMDHDMNIDIERRLLPKQLQLAKDLEIELLATNDSHYANKEDHHHHEEFLCIQSKSQMSAKTYDEGGNRFAFDGTQFYLKTAEEMAALFPPEDFPNALKNTVKIAEMAQDVRIDFDPHLKPKPILLNGETEVQTFQRLIKEGLKERYADKPKEIQEEAKRRVQKEYKVITSSDFVGYFLTVAEYMNWTRENYATKNQHGEVVALPVGDGRGCFVQGAQVETADGLQAIEHVSPGDTVLTHDGSYQKVYQKHVYEVRDEEMVTVYLSNGHYFTATADHLIFSQDEGYIPAGSLQKGDKLAGRLVDQEVIPDALSVTETPRGVYRDGVYHSERFQQDYKVFSSQEIAILGHLEGHLEVENVTQHQDATWTVELRDGTHHHVDKISEITEVLSLRDHETVTVTAIRHVFHTGFVYDLGVEHVQNYTLGGITVHNSVGGSIIAYLLKISELCPIRHDLIFERFLSAGRGATYEITYDDGTTEQIIVSDEKKVVIEDWVVSKYIHELSVGDEILDQEDSV